jgi:hypothetical protein
MSRDPPNDVEQSLRNIDHELTRIADVLAQLVELVERPPRPSPLVELRAVVQDLSDEIDRAFRKTMLRRGKVDALTAQQQRARHALAMLDEMITSDKKGARET